MSKEEKFKLALFMIIRNFKVMPVGLQLGKNEHEINQMTVNTITEILNMTNYEKAKEMFEDGNKRLMNEKEKKALESVKNIFEDISLEELIKNKDINVTIYSSGILDILRVIGIVERQQKEIERLQNELIWELD
jgi:CheY-specific phosphatase CheX